MQIEALKTLAAVVIALPARDQEFANSLLTQARERYKRNPSDAPLSEKQFYWVQQLVRRAQPAPADANVGKSADGIRALFAKVALKRPTLRVQAGDARLTISKAAPHSRNAGCLYVKSGDAYVGKIDPQGAFIASREISDEQRAAAIEALASFAADPVKAATLYGQMTGQCCMCGLALTDARSVTVGYGPICAKNWGLPWGHAADQTVTEEVTLAGESA